MPITSIETILEKNITEKKQNHTIKKERKQLLKADKKIRKKTLHFLKSEEKEIFKDALSTTSLKMLIKKV